MKETLTPNLNKAASEGIQMFGLATKIVAAPAKEAFRRLNHRNPETGAPEGSLAVMKSQLIRRVFSRRPRIV